jgi:hypothetical protein
LCIIRVYAQCTSDPFNSQEKVLVEIDGDRAFEEMFQDVKMLINSKQLG